MKLSISLLGFELFAVERSDSAADGLAQVLLGADLDIDPEAVETVSDFGFCRDPS